MVAPWYIQYSTVHIKPRYAAARLAVVWCGGAVERHMPNKRAREREKSTTNKNTYQRRTSGMSIENYVCLLFSGCFFLNIIFVISVTVLRICLRFCSSILERFFFLNQFQVQEQKEQNENFLSFFVLENRKSSQSKLYWMEQQQRPKKKTTHNEKKMWTNAQKSAVKRKARTSNRNTMEPNIIKWTYKRVKGKLNEHKMKNKIKWNVMK